MAGVVVIAGRYAPGSVVKLFRLVGEIEIRAETSQVDERVVDQNGNIGFAGLEAGERYIATAYREGVPDELRLVAHEPEDVPSELRDQIQPEPQTIGSDAIPEVVVDPVPPPRDDLESGAPAEAAEAAGIPAEADPPLQPGEEAAPAPADGESPPAPDAPAAPSAEVAPELPATETPAPVEPTPAPAEVPPDQTTGAIADPATGEVPQAGAEPVPVPSDAEVTVSQPSPEPATQDAPLDAPTETAPADVPPTTDAPAPAAEAAPPEPAPAPEPEVAAPEPAATPESAPASAAPEQPTVESAAAQPAPEPTPLEQLQGQAARLGIGVQDQDEATLRAQILAANETPVA